MNKEKMIDRVKKLFALAENNPSQEEAISATLKAQKLMAQYNIHEDDLMEEVKEDIGSVISSQANNSKLMGWRFQLAATIGKSFRCKVYKYGNQVAFRGYKGDAEIALQSYISLYNIGAKLAHNCEVRKRKECGTGAGAYNSFVSGFLFGISDALDRQCTALMIVMPEKVEKDWEDFTKNMTKTHTHRLSVTNPSMYHEGYEAGKNAIESNRIEEKTYA